MPATRHRRIVRRALMAAVALLPVAYVATWGWMYWLVGRFLLRSPNFVTIAMEADATAFAPLRLYAESDIPGGKSMHNFAAHCFSMGAEASQAAGDWTPAEARQEDASP